jgi:hypothetical protein
MASAGKAVQQASMKKAMADGRIFMAGSASVQRKGCPGSTARGAPVE